MRKRDEQVRVGTEDLELWRTATDRETFAPGTELKFVVPLARTSDPATSHAAAASMVDHAGAQRQAILEYLLAHPEGATADELDDLLGWRPSTAGRRLGELLGAQSIVRLDGQDGRERVTRKTRQGREAFVHRRA